MTETPSGKTMESHIRLKCGEFDIDNEGVSRINMHLVTGDSKIEEMKSCFSTYEVKPTVGSYLFVQEYESASNAEKFKSKFLSASKSSEVHLPSPLKDENVSKVEVAGNKLVLAGTIPAKESEFSDNKFYQLLNKLPIAVQLRFMSPVSGAEFFKGTEAHLPFLALFKAFYADLTATYDASLIWEAIEMSKAVKGLDKNWPIKDGSIAMDLEVGTYEEVPTFIKTALMQPSIINAATKMLNQIQKEIPFLPELKGASSKWKLVIAFTKGFALEVEAVVPGATQLLS